MAPGTGSTRVWSLKLMLPGTWIGMFRSTRRSTGRINMPPTLRGPMPGSMPGSMPGLRFRGLPRATQGALSNYKNLAFVGLNEPLIEPADHGLGRSRGGVSTKIHQLVDGRCRPLVIAVGPGQGGDSPMFGPLLERLSVKRLGRGRPRTRPDAVLADKAYSSRANRGLLRRRGITAVISEPADQAGHRRRRGSAGGRPPKFDSQRYRGRNTVERSFNAHKQWRGIATRYDKLATVYRGAVVLRAITIWLT